jgi:hypothetical protein
VQIGDRVTPVDRPVANRLLLRLALLSLLLPTAACSPRPEAPAAHVVVLGLDGGTWDLLEPYIERGLLPNLARLRAQGAWGPLQSINPSSSPVIWTSIATGKSPDKHGITFFVRFPEGKTGEPGPVTSTMRRGKAIWNILSAKGYDVATVGWFVTWPVESVNGRMISDRAHWGATDSQGVAPPYYLAGFDPPTIAEAMAALPQFARFDLDPGNVHSRPSEGATAEERLQSLVFERLVTAYLRDLYYLRVAERVLADGRLPDFFALYLRGTDDVQHGFWKFMEPELFAGVTSEQIDRFGKVIERYWQWTDAAVGRILEFYKDTPRLVLVVSDHGAGPAIGRNRIVTKEYLELSGSHRETGILIANGPGVRRSAEAVPASVYDVTPTILHYLGLPVGDDMDGRPILGLFSGAVADREIARLATYDEKNDQAREHVASEVDHKALDHLRSLGYIE